jgi:4-hydroxybenzoate polyprenyltransferase
VASGRVSATAALILAFSLCMAGLAMAWGLGLPVVALAGLYLVLNLAYSLGLKHVSVLDIFIVSAGYVIRVLIGALWVMYRFPCGSSS